MSSATPTPSYGPGSNQGSNGLGGQDPFSQSPSVYLYGFLATLILIFLISLFVAYRGYRTRRMLRQRIEEALARGVNLTGFSDGTSSRGRRIHIGEKPSLLDVWIQAGDVPPKSTNSLRGQNGTVPTLIYADWSSLKPIALTSTQRRPIAEDAIGPNPPLVRPIPSRFPRSLVEAFREYWLPGESATPSSRAAMPAGWNDSSSPVPATNANDAPSSRPSNTMRIVDALEQARVGVFIAMPDPSTSHRFPSRRALNRQSVASTSTLGPNLGVPHAGPEELPALVIGTSDVALPLPEIPSVETKIPDLQRETTAEASGTHAVNEIARSSPTPQGVGS